MEKKTYYTIDFNEYLAMEKDPQEDIYINGEEFDGEVEGLRNLYDNVKEAVNHAVERLGFNYPTSDHIEIYDEDEYQPHVTLDFLVNRSMKEATEEEIKEWEAGELTLYQLEWELYITKFTFQPIERQELESVLA